MTRQLSHTLRTPIELTDDELRDLALFLARRIRPDLRPVQARIGAIQGIDPELVQGWSASLQAARSAGTLARVVRDAADACPGDLALDEAASLFGGTAAPVTPVPRESSRAYAVLTLAGVALAVLLVVSLASVGVWAGLAAAGARSAPVAASASSPAPATPAPAPAQVPVAPGPRVVVAAPAAVPVESAAPVAPDRVAPLVADEPMGSVTRVPRVEDGPPEGPLEPSAAPDLEKPCKVSGWFYAGRGKPESPYVVNHPVRVRAAPPTAENGWNIQAPIRCYLARGDEVRFAEPPLALPHGHYWIHLEPSEVYRPVDVASGDTGSRRR
ncbi:MAG: hypothetical protein ABMB14_12875 [Myxococcota bacterium]